MITWARDLVPLEDRCWSAQWVPLCGVSQHVAHLDVLLLCEPFTSGVPCEERLGLVSLEALFLAWVRRCRSRGCRRGIVSRAMLSRFHRRVATADRCIWPLLDVGVGERDGKHAFPSVVSGWHQFRHASWSTCAGWSSACRSVDHVGLQWFGRLASR